MNEVFRKILFLPEQGSTFAYRADHLHFFIIAMTMVVGAIIGAVALYFLIRYRRRSETDVTPKIEAPKWLEGIFIGFPLTFFLLWAAIGFHDYVWAHHPPKDAMDVYVTGKQWMWKFAYVGGPSELSELHVPIHRPIRALITSRDVIHSFFVPAFRMKTDAVPGRYTEEWFEVTKPGTYEVLCAEYCGLNHSVMRARVIAMEPDAFERWQERERQKLPAQPEDAQQQTPLAFAPLVDQGRVAASSAGCMKCHTIDGTPHIGPSWLGLYKKTEKLDDGTQVVADEAYLTQSIMQPGAKVVAGYQNLMPAFQGQLPAPEIAAIVEYIKSLKPQSLATIDSKEPLYGPRPH